MKDKVAEGPFQLRSFKFHLATLESWIKEEYPVSCGRTFFSCKLQKMQGLQKSTSIINRKTC